MNLLETTEGLPLRILPWIIERANSDDEFAAHEVTSRGLLHLQLWAAAHSPSKLAEMIASEARRRGWVAIDSWAPVRSPYVRVLPLADGVDIDISVEEGESKSDVQPMPQARTILAALLQLPDGAREQAERILRGET